MEEAAAKELEHLADWIKDYYEDGMRPDEWTMKEWERRLRVLIPPPPAMPKEE